MFGFFKLFTLYWSIVNNVVLVSGVQQSDSVIHTHVCILFEGFFPFMLLYNIEQSSPCYTIGPFKYSSVSMSIRNSLTSPLSYPSSLVTIILFSKSVSLFLFCK